MGFSLFEQADLLFLYCLDISEADYHVLKREQDLIVDFGAFPHFLHAKLVALRDATAPPRGEPE